MKHILDQIKDRLDVAKEYVGKFEDIAIENSQNEKKTICELLMQLGRV